MKSTTANNENKKIRAQQKKKKNGKNSVEIDIKEWSIRVYF